MRNLESEIQRCTLRSDPGGWSPAVHAAIGPWQRLKSGGAHCARTLVEELGEWDAAAHTAIRSWLTRSSGANCGRSLACEFKFGCARCAAIGAWRMNAAEHAAIGAWRMKSGGGHCCRTLVEEAGGWGPTVHTAIRTWRRGLARRRRRTTRRRKIRRKKGRSSSDKIWQPPPGRSGIMFYFNDLIYHVRRDQN